MTKEQASREIDSLDFYLQNHTDDYGEESHTAMMMAKDALSSSGKPNKWIPIEKALPEVGIDVLICDMEGTIYLSHRSSFDMYFDEWGNKIKGIVAWMPLPEPYKAEGSDKK